jgi:hypothetical protein
MTRYVHKGRGQGQGQGKPEPAPEPLPVIDGGDFGTMAPSQVEDWVDAMLPDNGDIEAVRRVIKRLSLQILALSRRRSQ